MFERIIIVTRKTRLEELIVRFNTKSQAKFYIEQEGLDFYDYQLEYDSYKKSLEVVRSLVPIDFKVNTAIGFVVTRPYAYAIKQDDVTTETKVVDVLFGVDIIEKIPVPYLEIIF